MNQRTTTPLERSVFRHLDILLKEGTITARAIVIKWKLSTEDAVYLIRIWNQNHNEAGDYSLIQMP